MRPLLWLVLLLPLLLAACGDGPADPEARLRASIAAAEQSIEARELKAAVAHISPDYRDEHGRDVRQMRQLLLGYLYRNRDIHLFTRVADLQLSADGRTAEVRLYVAMAGVPIASPEAVAGLRSDMHRLDLRFVDGEEGWQLLSGQWRRASLDELLR